MVKYPKDTLNTQTLTTDHNRVTMPYYNSVLYKLSKDDSIEFKGATMNIQVGDDSLDEAVDLLEEWGAEVVSDNQHEAGHTIYFHFPDHE